MKTLDEHLNAWNLSDPVALSVTPTSHLYNVMFCGTRCVLKIPTATGREDEKGAAYALAAYNGDGAIRLIHHDDGAQLLEYADGPDLISMVAAGRDDEASAIMAGLLNTLHKNGIGRPHPECVFLEARFQSLFQAAAQGGLYDRAARVARHLLDTAEMPRLLHGDMHHGNVLFHQARGWLAIDPKGVWGERTYDAANILCNPHGMARLVLSPERLAAQARIIADILHIDIQRLLSFGFVHAALSAAWLREDGYDPAVPLATARMVEAMTVNKPYILYP